MTDIIESRAKSSVNTLRAALEQAERQIARLDGSNIKAFLVLLDQIEQMFGDLGTEQSALRAEQGDAIVVTLDGGALPGTYTTAQFEISASQWQAAATDSVEHQLQVSIMDRSGKLLITSAPQSFYVHRATVGGRAR